MFKLLSSVALNIFLFDFQLINRTLIVYFNLRKTKKNWIQTKLWTILNAIEFCYTYNLNVIATACQQNNQPAYNVVKR